MLPLVKVDEDLPEQVADCFSKAGYFATTVRIQGWSGISDLDLWRKTQAENRTLVTADKSFGDIRNFQPSPTTAIILFRLTEESRRGYVELAEAALRVLRLEEILGCLAVVTTEGIRIRRISL